MFCEPSEVRYEVRLPLLSGRYCAPITMTAATLNRVVNSAGAHCHEWVLVQTVDNFDDCMSEE